MTHFTALNRHGKLSVLGRVSPAAAPACHASTKRELFSSLISLLADRLLKNFHISFIITNAEWTQPHPIKEFNLNLELIIWKIILRESCYVSDKDGVVTLGTHHDDGT